MVALIGRLELVSGGEISHPWDANAYLITGDEPLLIDCGGSEGYPALARNLRRLGYQPKDVKKVLATHGHWDHLSAMALMRGESDTALYVHEADKEQVETGDHDLTASFLYDRSFPPAEVNGLLEDGDVFMVGGYRFHVVHTPGHSPGSVSFWAEIEGSRVLIAGDALWGGFHPRIRSDLDDWSNSLDRLLALNIDVMMFGHGPPTLAPGTRLKDARRQLGVYFNPWFEPFYNGSGGHVER